MKPIITNKLLNSKWTALRPTDQEKHFIVTALKKDTEGFFCVLESVYSKRHYKIGLEELKNPDFWQMGWLETN
ncbi:MAG: TIGR02450 family Trp-rich protein [Pseudomonadota bacterium]|nr:TIGR02450 family Trp-rich protein [Pseudomonadota bacterium]